MGRRLRTLAAVVLAGAVTLGLSGCRAAPAPAETQIFAMDTIMSLTVHGPQAQQALDGAVEEIYRLDRTLSATDPESAVFALNDGTGDWVELDDTGCELLGRALELGDLTAGALDVTAYSAVKAWGFTTGNYRVPGWEELQALADRIDYSAVELDRDGLRARLPKDMALDLGSVAKGYAGDLLSRQLREQGVTSALLDLGQSSIQAVGGKPDGSPWRIGLQDPEGQGYLAVVQLDGMAMGTSGGYQRFFREKGHTYWHIIDPRTAAPARTGLASVTVVSPSGLLCDGLSTALFVMGEERGVRLWRDHPELPFDVIFVGQDGHISITAGLEEHFSLAQGYEDREVTVLR